MPDTLHVEMPAGKTERDWQYRSHCRADGEPWPCRSVLITHLDALTAADRWWAERFRTMHRSDPAGRRAYLEMQTRANNVEIEHEQR